MMSLLNEENLFQAHNFIRSYWPKAIEQLRKFIIYYSIIKDKKIRAPLPQTLKKPFSLTY